MMEEGGVRVLEKRREPGAGLRMLLEQTVTFPRPIRAWNPRTGFMEEKSRMDIVFDASIPEEQYANYEGYSVGKDSKGKILVLLASLGYSYPTTAIAEATGVAKSTSQRLLWELKRDGLLEGAYSTGSYVDSEIWPYRYGHLRENYWILASEGAKRAEELMRMKVAPLVPPRELVEKELKEHPWLRPDEAERIVREHVEDTRRRVEEIRAKQARGETLTTQDLKVIYGEEAVSEELREERERVEKPETPWDAAGRRAEEARKKYDKST
ncbi:MAG: hypothetical protein Q8O76_14075 [Chloroflexota bacterium]|nr:hypothetical protein [Chloroflexota bacterium]